MTPASQFLSIRRCTALGISRLSILMFSSVFLIFQSADTSSEGQDSRPRAQVPSGNPGIPFLIHQKSYFPEKGTQSTKEFLQIACVSWGFDGVELSLQALLAEANSGGQDIEKMVHDLCESIAGQKNLSDAYIHLAIDTSRPQDIEEARVVINALPIRSCSIALPSDKGRLAEVEQWLKSGVGEKIEILIEPADLRSGVDFQQYVQWVNSSLSREVGLLVSSDAVQYRFDLALRDLRVLNEKKGERRQAIRFSCVTTDVSTSDIADFDRTTFRRALANQILRYSNDDPPLFVSVESSKGLKWKKMANGQQVGLGSKTFRDMIVAIRDELQGTKVPAKRVGAPNTKPPEDSDEYQTGRN